MKANLSFGVLAQKFYPGKGAGPLDDCWVCAFLAALHAVAPWEFLPNIRDFRKAAGVPDGPSTSDGGKVVNTAKALKTFWPEIHALSRIGDTRQFPWSDYTKAMDDGATVYLHVLSSALPPSHQFGFKGIHAVAAGITDELRLCNPLAPPHSRWAPITAAQLDAAQRAYSKGNPYGIILPTTDAAFVTHPLYQSGDCAPLVAEARKQGYAEAKAAATVAVEGI